MSGRGSSSVFRIMERDNPFTPIPNETLRDFRLSCKALGLLTRLLSNTDGWRIDSRSLARQFKEGRDAILSMTNELIEHGYVVRRKYQDGRGWWVTEYQVYQLPVDPPSPLEKGAIPLPDMPDDPTAYRPDDANAQVSPRPGFPDTDFPDTDFPAPDNPATYKRTGPKEQTDDDERRSPPVDVVDNHVADGDDEFGGRPTIRLLADSLALATNRAISWNLAPQKLADLDAAIRRVGDVQPFVDLAIAQDEAKPEPGRLASAYMKGWVRLHPVPQQASASTTAPSRPDWCGQCQSDSYRFIEAPDGSSVHRCPTCNPSPALF